MSAANQILINALTEVRDIAMRHPCFHPSCFEERDIKCLANHGGDICDWTMIAIIADDALNEYQSH